MTENAQQRLVAAQFGPRARAYVESAVHSAGEDLDQLCDLIRGQATARVLDLGCGAGHVSLRLAPLVRHVTAYDLAAPMLAAVDQLARERGCMNISTRKGAVESLPFADASFDFVVSRYSAHHWSDFGAALREARRVLAPGGHAVFIDVIAPERPGLDTFLQTLELLRDPSHVRNYSVSEWTRALEAAGFRPGQVTGRRLRLDFASWIGRMATSETHVAAIQSLQRGVADDTKAYFEIEGNGSFTIDAATFEAVC